MGVRILATGAYSPDKVLSNSDLEKMVETSDEWITTRTGIKQRRIAAPEQATSDLAFGAASKAIEMAGIKPEDISAITVATLTPDKTLPSTACILQKKLGASNAICFDIQAACSGLLYSLEVAISLLRSNKNYKYFLVVGAEKLSSVTDWSDRGTCVLFGDGASAVLLERTDTDEDCLIACKLGSDGNYADILHIPAGGSAMPASHETVDGKLHFIKMGGQEVFKLAVNGMVGACKDTLASSGVANSSIAWVVPHQANLRILKAVASRLDIPEEKVYVNVDRFGNTSAASIGLCLDEMFRAGKIKHGDYVLLTAFGGGLTWGAMLLRW